ncbi:MAG: hypothetical protein V1752_05170 [Candidatus Firestonebacteria bacterium]
MRKKVFTAKSSPKYLYGALILLPLALYYFTVYLFAENIPLSDDFPTVLGFLSAYLSLENTYDKICFLFSQFNEHRIVVNKLVSLAVYKVNGAVDFRQIILIGNIMLLPAIYAVYISFKKNKDKFKYFIPVVFVIAVPQFTGAIFWATSVVQNISCLAFSLLALALLKKEGISRSITAFTFAILAVFSAGNGLFVLPAVIILLLFVKRKKAAVWWSIGAVFILLIYFYGYTTPVHDKLYYAGKPLSVIEFFFVFIGSPAVFNVFYMKNLLGYNAELIIRLVSAIFGAAVIAYFILLAKKKYYTTNPVIFTMFILFFLTAIAAAVTRSGIGPMQAFTSRYRIIPVFIFALAYLSFVEISKEKKAEKYYKYLIVLAVVFSFLSYITNLPEIKSCKDNLVFGITNWQKSGRGLERLNDDPVYAEKQIKNSIEKSIYFPGK